MYLILNRIRDVIISTGLSDSEFAKQIEIPQSTFANMFIRQSDPKAEILEKIVKVFKVNANWLLTGEGTMFTEGEKEAGEGNMRIPVLGSTVTGKGAAEKYLKPSELLPSLSAASLCAYRMNDTSMAGADISEGDIILLDTSAASSPLPDDLYVFSLEGRVYCKFLKFDPICHTVRIYSLHSPGIKTAEELRTIDCTNPENAELVHIFGRVVAWFRQNRLVSR